MSAARWVHEAMEPTHKRAEVVSGVLGGGWFSPGAQRLRKWKPGSLWRQVGSGASPVWVLGTQPPALAGERGEANQGPGTGDTRHSPADTEAVPPGTGPAGPRHSQGFPVPPRAE